MKKKSQKSKKRTGATEKSELKTYLISALKGLILFFTLFALSAFICYKADAEHKYYYIIMIIICVISGFFGGVFTSGKMKEKGIICGFLGALPIIAVSLTASIAVGGFALNVKLLVACLVILLSGVIGGILTANMRR